MSRFVFCELNAILLSCSEFKDIFDLKYFIESLGEDVNIVDALPPHLAQLEPVTKAPVSWSKVKFFVHTQCMKRLRSMFVSANIYYRTCCRCMVS